MITMENLLYGSSIKPGGGGGGVLGGVITDPQQRGLNALQRRAQQLKKWQECEDQLDRSEFTSKNKHPSLPKIRFSDKTLFLAACANNDIEECKRLLKTAGIDINVVNVDGMTGLHQACIDDNIDMVNFLIENGADINACDNDGWTPLHATASCGHLAIAEILLDAGADPTIVNNDGELACDIADTEEVEELIQRKLVTMGYSDLDELRQMELITMKKDIEKWKTTGILADKPHPRTGATILHVAASKGYSNIISSILEDDTLRKQINIDAVDHEHWTPLAAACYWQQPEVVEVLLSHKADVNFKTPTGQTLEDLMENESILKMIENQRKKLKDEEEKVLEERRKRLSNGPVGREKVVLVIPTSPSSGALAGSSSGLVQPTPPTETQTETQRKAHAKRVRETRRSTQGISADDVSKAKDQLQKQQQQQQQFQQNNNNCNNFDGSSNPSSSTTPSSSMPATTAQVQPPRILHPPSPPASSTFNPRDLEQNPIVSKEPTVSNSTTTASTTTGRMNNEPSVVTVNTTQSSLSQVGTGKESWKADVSNNVVPSSQLSTSTSLDGQERKASLNKTPLKAPSAQASVLAPSIGSDNQSVVGTRFGGNKSNNNIATSTSTTNSSPATQPKINNNTINNSTSNGNNINSHQINEDASSTVRTSNDQQSDPSSYRSRSASRTSSSNKSESDITHSASNKLSSSNGSSDDGKDYKKLYEESLLEVERLKKEFAAKEQEFNREKRQQQRKISEYEEELKMLEILRSDNQRLKDENGALIRVISKLSK